jgi:hypothetical protein
MTRGAVYDCLDSLDIGFQVCWNDDGSGKHESRRKHPCRRNHILPLLKPPRREISCRFHAPNHAHKQTSDDMIPDNIEKCKKNLLVSYLPPNIRSVAKRSNSVYNKVSLFHVPLSSAGPPYYRLRAARWQPGIVIVLGDFSCHRFTASNCPRLWRISVWKSCTRENV